MALFLLFCIQLHLMCFAKQNLVRNYYHSKYYSFFSLISKEIWRRIIRSIGTSDYAIYQDAEGWRSDRSRCTTPSRIKFLYAVRKTFYGYTHPPPPRLNHCEQQCCHSTTRRAECKKLRLQKCIKPDGDK